ncbi:centromere protein X-like isoform X1 [Pomacea canaliculata]|uniref:centromere protein X-like isoform X1 n=1 Tax=Pomacea canaliculata TaxID=400727 RepID=UPI000D72CE7A|nr:centromere protein X-like isoform X1 [Pomacea canaliculata]
MADVQATFKARTVQSVLQLHFKDEKTKVNGDALVLTAELLRVFTSEAAERAAMQAKKEGSKLVTVEHVEKVLPQLLLDV